MSGHADAPRDARVLRRPRGVSRMTMPGRARRGRPSCASSATTPTRSWPACCRAFEALRARGCDEATVQAGRRSASRLQREIERLAVVCPAHAPTLMANAVIAYDEQRPAEAQQMLDVILAQPRAYPDAAVLSARIAHRGRQRPVRAAPARAADQARARSRGPARDVRRGAVPRRESARRPGPS